MQYPQSTFSPPGATAPKLPLSEQALTSALERKDRYTAGHAKRTAHYAVKIASVLPAGADSGFRERVRLAALLHDLGKLEVEDAILLKRSELCPEERGRMREHPRLGFEALGSVDEHSTGEFSGPALTEIAAGVRHHHERWDGQGYPDGLAGSRIPWIARLIAVADAYDAMVSTRPYRRGISPSIAYAEVLRQSGTQFDPEIVDAFARAFAAE